MWILVDMVDAIGVKHRGAALDTMDDIPFLKKVFTQVCAILSGDAGY